MCDNVHKAFEELYKRAEQDEEYLSLEKRRKEQEPEALVVLRGVPREQLDTLIDYFGICEEMHLRLLELLCFQIDDEARGS